MVHYKLHYFDSRGWAEPIRLILQYAGQKYYEERYSIPDWETYWPEKKKAGCGLFNEGPPELRAAQMHDSINVQLAALPEDTKVYPGHEYTVPNLQFARIIDPNNPSVKDRLQWAENKRKHGEPTIPSTIGEEKSFNPFMRVDNTELQKRIGAENAIDAMAKLRQMKNEIHIDFLRDSINWKPEDDIIFK